MIIPDSEKSESSVRNGSGHNHTSFGPVDDPPSPPPYSPTIASSDDRYQDGGHSPHSATFHPTSSAQPNLPPRCNHLVDRKTFSSLSGTWHVDTALEIPERLLPAITDFDGRWNREAQQARKTRAEELRRRQGRASDSTRRPLPPFMETRPNLMLGATNGAISGDIHVVSSDGLVRQATVVAEGFNGSVNLRVHAPSDQLLRLFVSSINGSVSVKIPSSFEGALKMSTSWGNINASPSVEAKLTTFSSTLTTSQSFVGDWQAQGFGAVLNSSDPNDDPPLPGSRDPFTAWNGPLIDISSSNGSVSVSFIEEDATSYAGQFTRTMQRFMDSWFGRGGHNGGGVPMLHPPMFNPPQPPMFHPTFPHMFGPSPPGTWSAHPRSPVSHAGVGTLDLD